MNALQIETLTTLSFPSTPKAKTLVLSNLFVDFKKAKT